MASNRQRLEEANTGSQPNGNSTDELAELSSLRRGTVEVLILKTLKRFVGPTLVPIIRPLIRQIVREEIGYAQQELLTSNKEIPVNKASTSSVPKKLKTQFRTRVSEPVFTGMPLLGENKTPIEVGLVNADTGEIVNTGTESALKLEIIACPVDDDDCGKQRWTVEEFHNRILREKKGTRILQGDTCVQLKEGVGFVGEISFTFNSKHTKNGLYKLGAVVMDAALMNGVEVAWTDSFLVKDKRSVYSANHPCPSLFDKVHHLQQISKRGERCKRLKDAGVNIVKDLLIILHREPERLRDSLKPKSSKIWDDIINHALKSDGLFVYLDPTNERNGVVVDVKLQLKGLIVESHHYLTVHQLSDNEMVEARKLVKFARERLEVLHPVKDETSLIERLQSGNGFSSLPPASQSLGTSMIIDTSSQATCSLVDNLDSSNSHTGQSTNQVPAVTSQSERGKEVATFDNEMSYPTNDYQDDDLLFHLSDLEGPNENNPPTEPDTSVSPSSMDRPRRPSECSKITDSHKKRRFDDHPQIAYSPPDMQYFLESMLYDSDQDPMQYFAVDKAQRRWKIVSRVVEFMSEIRKRDVIKSRPDGNVVGVVAAGFN